MSEGLKALENILKQELIKPNKYRKTIGDIASAGQVITIQKELKEGERSQLKLKALGNFVLKNKALNEILALHNKWLGNEMSDFEFFTLLSEIKDKYGLSKEVLL